MPGRFRRAGARHPAHGQVLGHLPGKSVRDSKDPLPERRVRDDERVYEMRGADHRQQYVQKEPDIQGEGVREQDRGETESDKEEKFLHQVILHSIFFYFVISYILIFRYVHFINKIHSSKTAKRITQFIHLKIAS